MAQKWKSILQSRNIPNLGLAIFGYPGRSQFKRKELKCEDLNPEVG